MPLADCELHPSISCRNGINSRMVWLIMLTWIPGVVHLPVASWGQPRTYSSSEISGNMELAAERYRALYESTNGEIGVYYDYLEEGKLAGGITSVVLPAPGASIAKEAMPQWSVTTLIDNGPSANRVDIVLLGDGYTESELGDYATQVNNVLALFMQEEPLAAYASYVNVHRVDVISNESGVDNDPEEGVERDTALDMNYFCGGTERLLCINVSKAITAAALAPDMDQILALANSSKYGGAGYASSDLATLSGNNSSSVEVALHEFGHSFANLADEYDYGGGPTYTGPEPTQPNISIYDADDQLGLQTKWYRWLDLPEVDAFEGAHYCLYGIYRPTNSSKMQALNRPFQAVNVEQFVINFYKLVSPIDDATPASPIPLPAGTTFFVTPLQPVDHALDLQWSLDGEPVSGATGAQFTADWCSMEPGIYEVSVTVVDNTERVRDETARATWMTERRQWQIEVPFRADITGDGTVDLADVLVLQQSWLQAPPYPSADIGPCPVGDNQINLYDLAFLAQYWLYQNR